MEKSEVKFHFIKSNDCKEFFANGMFGGLCPNGNISFAIYSERPPIPKEVVHSIIRSADGVSLGHELIGNRVGKADYVRIVQAVVQMDVNVAKSFSQWLQDRINEAEKTR